MTAHANNHSGAGSLADEDGTGRPASRARSTRPRWLMPAVAVVLVVLGLVAAGIVPLTTAIYGAFFGGMVLMHLVPGLHGGHGGHGGGRAEEQDANPSAPRGSNPDEGPGEGSGAPANRPETRGSQSCH